MASALRRLSLSKALTTGGRDEVLLEYDDLPLMRHGHPALLDRVLELENLSAYDGVYVALVEALSAELVTADEPLGRAVRAHTSVSLVELERRS